MKTLIVSKSQQSCLLSDNIFSTITEALDSIKDNEDPVVIFIKNGIYKEKITVSRPCITFVGEDARHTIITYDDHAKMIMPDKSKCGTFRSYTFFVDSHDISFSNITFENSSGFGADVGQAIAMYVDGDRIVFDNCIFLGSQDTLFTGPLPPSPVKPGGFTGPKEFAERINGRHYYHNCFLRGDIDFIFGSATAYFEDCEIFPQITNKKQTDKNGNVIYSYITASSTPYCQQYGYVFNNCKIRGNSPNGSVYLGRPWRNYAKTIFMNSYLSEQINEAGWHDWNKEDAHDTIFYAEYNNYGPGFIPQKRASFSKILTDTEALEFTKENVLRGTDNWNPSCNYKYLFFDLDGTLTNPKLGITNSVAYALKSFGIEVADNNTLIPFIGPPLVDSFEQFYNFPHDKALLAVEKYREYFSDKGIYENEIIEGIPNILEQLINDGKILVLATSKPEVYAKRILEHFNLDKYFTFISAPLLDGTRNSKTDVIEYALKALNIKDTSKVLMIGDRKHDIEGAVNNNIKSAGVLFGFGDEEELKTAGADYIAELPEDILKIIC